MISSQFRVYYLFNSSDCYNKAPRPRTMYGISYESLLRIFIRFNGWLRLTRGGMNSPLVVTDVLC